MRSRSLPIPGKRIARIGLRADSTRRGPACQVLCNGSLLSRWCALMHIETVPYCMEDSKAVGRSTSCGVSYMLSRNTIMEGGVVFGAAFDKNWLPHHIVATTVEELEAFRGSKYVASDVGDCYEQARNFLRKGRKVLFSGTPCQIAALKAYLGRDDNNLLTISIVCHGVGSPLVWNKYLDEKLSSLNILRSDISRLEFRDHGTSGRVCISIYTSNEKIPFWSEEHQINDYMRAYGRDYILREECYECGFKLAGIGADVIVGDYWGGAELTAKANSRKSTVIIHSQKGRLKLSALGLTAQRVPLSSLISQNYPLLHSAPRTSRVEYFFKHVGTMPFSILVNRTDRIDFFQYCRARIRHNKKVNSRGAYLKTIIHSLYLFFPVRYRLFLHSCLKLMRDILSRKI